MRYYILSLKGTGDKFYTYLDKNDEYSIGEQVLVPFGRGEKTGVIVSEAKQKNYKFAVKPIKMGLKESIKFPEYLIKLFLWIQKYYLCSFEEILSIAYPQNLKVSYSRRYLFKTGAIPANDTEKNFLDYISKKKGIGRETLIKRYGKDLVEKFLKKGVIEEEKKVREKSYSIKNSELDIPEINYKKKLTEEQEYVKDEIVKGSDRFYLLKGVTGSGKTEVYIDIIKDALRQGNGAMFLVPEISLTPQMIKKFQSEFGNRVALLHSRLTAKERADEWHSVYRGEKMVVLGVRSAIFAPVKNLKYIIIDEEHETTYKQDSSPRYNAKYVAIKRAELEDVKVILGSATPAVESYYYAKNGIFKLLELNKRYNDAKMPSLKLIDMKNEADQYFSRELLKEMSIRLRKREQMILLLNRKSYATYIQCKECGHVEVCPNCSISMNYYRSDGIYKCNYCGYSKRDSSTCSSCGSANLSYSGKGTEKIEEEIKKHFPDARVIRVDSESVKTRNGYDKIYHDFLGKKYDIMLGTQVISKGLHFPDLTLVGVISADTILGFPDFRAGEKTFQLVSQASGRAGREKKEGEVLVQSYQPDNYAIKRIIDDDYEGFYQDEIENRKILSYPPFSRIINIIISSTDEAVAEEAALKYYEKIKNPEVEMYGPIKAPIYKVKERYRYQIFIKGDRTRINKIKKNLYEKSLEHKSNKVRITIDVDPINLM